LLWKDTSASTKVFGGLGSFWFALVAERLQKGVQSEAAGRFLVGGTSINIFTDQG